VNSDVQRAEYICDYFRATSSNIEKTPEIAIMFTVDELNSKNSRGIKLCLGDYIDNIVEETPENKYKIIVDMKNVRGNVDSEGYSALLVLNTLSITNFEKKIRVINCNYIVERGIVISGLDDKFEVEYNKN